MLGRPAEDAPHAKKSHLGTMSFLTSLVVSVTAPLPGFFLNEGKNYRIPVDVVPLIQTIDIWFPFPLPSSAIFT